jgi:hypothetical protein
MVVASAVLVDVPTGYIRLVGEAYGQQSARGILGAVDFEELESEARKIALKALAQDVARRIADGA